MDVFYEATYHTDFRDSDPFGQCRPSAVLGYLQEASTGAAGAGHFSREQLLRDYNVFWMLARIRYQLTKPLSWDMDLTVRTWHRGNPGLMMYRDYDLFSKGVRIGEAVSIWVLVDKDTRQLCRMSNVDTLCSSSGGALCRDKTLPKLHIPPDLPLAEHRLLHYSDTDANGHVNNVRYADFACDAVGRKQTGKGLFVSALQLGFLHECRAGEVLDIRAGERDGIWYIHGTDKDSVSRFDASVVLSPLDKQ